MSSGDRSGMTKWCEGFDPEDIPQASMFSAVTMAMDYVAVGMDLLCTTLDTIAPMWSEMEPMRVHARVCRDLFLRPPLRGDADANADDKTMKEEDKEESREE